VFQKDLLNEADDADRINALIKKWVEKGVFDNYEEVRKMLISGKLPAECYADLTAAARKTIDRTIYHANKQIKATKEILSMQDSKGLLLICNDGNYLLPHLHFIGLICNILENKYADSDIDGFVYFTVNQVSRSQDDEFDHRLWYPVYGKIEDTFCDFVNDIGTAFNNEYFPKITGIMDSHKFVSDDIEEGMKQIDKLMYLPKSLAYKNKRGN
jgi:hypothetical protein